MSSVGDKELLLFITLHRGIYDPSGKIDDQQEDKDKACDRHLGDRDPECPEI